MIKPDNPPMNFAINENGQRLYTVSPFENSIAIYDTTGLQLTAYQTGVGATPARIVIPPMTIEPTAKSE